jgi:hypothetical protein
LPLVAHLLLMLINDCCNPGYAEMFSMFWLVSGSCLLKTSIQKLFRIMVFLMNSWLKTLEQKLMSD